MPKCIFQFLICFTLAVCIAGCKPGGSNSPNAGKGRSNSSSEQFLSLMNAGKNYYDQGDATNALTTYQKALAIQPNNVDLRLNLANAFLMNGQAEEAMAQADEVLKMDSNSAAAFFIKGSAYLRLANHAEAVKALENAKRIDPGVPATSFQLGLARMGLRQWEEAAASFKEGIALEPNRLHSAARYLLGQSLMRAGRQEEAEKELSMHQANLQEGGMGQGAATFEKSKYTQARVPFKLEQPDPKGIPVKMVDATQQAFGGRANDYAGPVGILDPYRNGRNSLFVLEKNKGFRLLWNTNGVFYPGKELYPANPGGNYSKALVGDLQNDRYEDVIVLGEQGSHLFRFATNGIATDASVTSRLGSLQAMDGVLIDLDFTGKLDLVAVTSTTNTVQVFRQFGALLFSDITSTSGVPATLADAHSVLMDDWNRDGHMDLVVGRKSGAPLLLEKKRGGPMMPMTQTNWPTGSVVCTGDFDNDLRTDMAVMVNGKLIISFNGGERKEAASLGDQSVTKIVAHDYDNDGWLDLWTLGSTIRVWRNLGVVGWEERTSELGLQGFPGAAVSGIHFADFDFDCDSDAVVTLTDGGLRFLRSEGGNANGQIKVQLSGNRSNASGIGCKVEIVTGELRLIRTVSQLPVEVGIGKYQQLDSFLVHWFNWPQGMAEVPVNCKDPLFSLELTIQEGSCPYVYVWDGERFSFVTDILGAAPVGLPVVQGRYIEADPEELVWIGNEKTFHPRKGAYEIQITEELREALYLDEAKLVVVDHEPGTEVHSTDKLLPGKPLPPGSLMTLHKEQALVYAETLETIDVTSKLKAVDGERVSPSKLLGPQLRGMAESHGVILDFGSMDTSKPLVLVMNGWLRFGGGMANIAASHDRSIPFPFPKLEAEVAPGIWKAVDVVVGAPAGKTKTILMDLDGKLPSETRRLRLTQGFEIHWDRIALMEKKTDAMTFVSHLKPEVADLHFRGFSKIKELPTDWPLTPDYDQVSPNSYWTIIPGGWCTRYGDVAELIAQRDEGLLVMNSGDELTLAFPQSSLPAKKPGMIREYFLYTDGWDKDSDFHVAAGTTVEPLPWHGMDDQLHGIEKRPSFPSDKLHRKYNTRWVDGASLKQMGKEARR